MKFEIDREFEDFEKKNFIGNFKANPNKTIYPSMKNVYPITFNGKISGKQIEIILKNQESDLIENYDFKIFPNDYNEHKELVVEFINDYMDKKWS